MTFHEFDAAWLGLSALSGTILGSAGAVIEGPVAAATLAAVAVGLSLFYALDDRLAARRTTAAPAREGDGDARRVER